ncbi:N-methyl-L-tryptophan oxidase [Algoriphagus hitonicola]|uniref:Sarcosine oxidase n=1 Tax=Algoriphagus hitonicola TaxID=435880 RepID=A0A1I2QJ40_9BACT|nr:N-methyl-L-tryptophan oxidase [Algoriphagus hitonicola]SFG27349.1 sarcosine oxidase [Algoriphagus hitonicola]
MKEYNAIVIGLGAVGSAALYFLSKSMPQVMGIDRFDPPHAMGSSHGETRITRLAVGEGQEYVKLARRSQEIWKLMEQESSEKLFCQVGGILLDSGLQPWSKYGGSSFFDTTCKIAQSENIRHEILNGVSIRNRYPAFVVSDQSRGYVEPSAGYVFPDRIIRTQLELAEKNGAKIRINQPVQAIRQNNGWVEVELTQERIRARYVVISVGGWIKDFAAKEEIKKFKICRQVLHWVAVEKGSPMADQNSVFMWGYGPSPTDFLYGFPSMDGETLKIASEQFEDVGHPDSIQRLVSQAEKDLFWEEKLRGKFEGLLPKIEKSEVCFYTLTPDAKFVILNHPQMNQVKMVSACSGHGFKHASALGEELAGELLASFG